MQMSVDPKTLTWVVHSKCWYQDSANVTITYPNTYETLHVDNGNTPIFGDPAVNAEDIKTITL